MGSYWFKLSLFVDKMYNVHKYVYCVSKWENRNFFSFLFVVFLSPSSSSSSLSSDCRWHSYSKCLLCVVCTRIHIGHTYKCLNNARQSDARLKHFRCLIRAVHERKVKRGAMRPHTHSHTLIAARATDQFSFHFFFFFVFVDYFIHVHSFACFSSAGTYMYVW